MSPDDIENDIEKALKWMLFILPGFLSITVIGFIIDLSQITEFQLTYYAFILTLINLVIGWGIKFLIPKKYSHKHGSKLLKFIFSVLIIIISIAVGLLIGVTAEGDTFYKVLR